MEARMLGSRPLISALRRTSLRLSSMSLAALHLFCVPVAHATASNAKLLEDLVVSHESQQGRRREFSLAAQFTFNHCIPLLLLRAVVHMSTRHHPPSSCLTT